MRRRLKKYGNSLALVIDKPVLELVGFTAETELEIRTDGNSLTLTPVQDVTSEELKEVFERITSRYDSTFRNLAK